MFEWGDNKSAIVYKLKVYRHIIPWPLNNRFCEAKG
jgi:hypothetical protein